jgi:hypothetical protein
MKTCNHDAYAQALAALDHATAAPLPSGGAVVHFPGGQPLVITAQTAETWASAAWPELSPEQITVLAGRLVEIADACPVPATRPKVSKEPLRKLTVLLEPDLAHTLMAERARIAAVEGVNVSLTSLATRAMRAGFERP